MGSESHLTSRKAKNEPRHERAVSWTMDAFEDDIIAFFFPITLFIINPVEKFSTMQI
jgi:hypothetical protein